jgi:hypothetical protein
MRRIALGLALTAICFAQTASIYELSNQDAAEGLKLHEAMVKADAAYTAWDAKMSKKYGQGTNVYGSDGQIHEQLDYSADFKRAVPKSKPQSILCPAYGCPAIAPANPLSICASCGTFALPATANPIGAYKYEPCGPGKGTGCLVGNGLTLDRGIVSLNPQ